MGEIQRYHEKNNSEITKTFRTISTIVEYLNVAWLKVKNPAPCTYQNLINKAAKNDYKISVNIWRKKRCFWMNVRFHYRVNDAEMRKIGAYNWCVRCVSVRWCGFHSVKRSDSGLWFYFWVYYTVRSWTQTKLISETDRSRIEKTTHTFLWARISQKEKL